MTKVEFIPILEAALRQADSHIEYISLETKDDWDSIRVYYEDKDVYYTLELSEYRFLNVPAVQVETQQQSDTNGLNNRPNTQTTPKSYTVVSGDCLWNIAKKYYGDGSQYTKIYEANKGTIGSNPNLIKPGQKLVIP